MQRRNFIKSVTAISAMSLPIKKAAAKIHVGETASEHKPFHAAVMRVPVLVPPNEDSLADVRRKNAEAMVASIEDLMKTSDPKPRIIVFPVLQYTSARRAVSGVPMSMVAVDLVSEPLDKGIFSPVVAACQRHKCYVATSTQERVAKKEGWYFHTGFIMGPEGLVLRSPKAQAQSAPAVSYLRDIESEYKQLFGNDSIMPVVKTPLGNLACYVEGEAEVLEASRFLASKGAEIILHTSMEEEAIPWLALKQAIAFQCHVFLLTGATSRIIHANNPVGEWYGGASTIIAPDGSILASKGDRDEGFALAKIDISAIDKAKKKFGRNTVPAWHLYDDLYSR